MKTFLRMLALAGMLAAVPVPAAAADFYTAGDSHCVELARLLGSPWKSVAENAVSTSELPKHLAKIPFGSFVIVCTGTNDAASRSLATLSRFYAGAATEVAKWRSQTLVWVGPSAVRRTGWFDRADQIDATFEFLMEAKGIRYISIFTDPAMQPADDVHLRAVQYRALGEAAALQLHD
jgi:lysophospholipase L1-like esterase